jgi:hypothetical protein
MMIVKIMFPDEELFSDADQISCVEVEPNVVLAGGLNDCLIDRTVHHDKVLIAPQVVRKKNCVTMYRNGKVFKQIMAFSPIYVLNEEGQTIDKF